ncbi:MAG: hypothetical protein ACI809_002431 [Candidatus Azotimanducaceae bacterium]|jgi:hypothetical protein
MGSEMNLHLYINPLSAHRVTDAAQAYIITVTNRALMPITSDLMKHDVNFTPSQHIAY